MAPKEFYTGNYIGVPVTGTFKLRLVCFALMMIIFSQCANSSSVVWNKTKALVLLKRRQKLLEIHKRLRALNKPAVKSIQSPDGDIIDCILRRKQRAFDHPLLRNHTIQEFPTFPSGFRVSSMANRTLKRPFQLWHLTGAACPKGTIPVRRTSAEDLMRFQSPRLYGKKFYGFHDRLRTLDDSGQENLDRQYATVVVSGGEYYGSTMATNIWNPKLADNRDNIVAQMWISGGSEDNPSLSVMEVGWQTDGYVQTGCYNLLCTGFIQTDHKVCLGGSVNTISSYEGTQYEELIFVWKERRNGGWWLVLNNYGRVGYWPSRIFTHLADHATRIQWGGEVTYHLEKASHSTTEMGSGHLAQEGFRRASYMRSLRIADSNYLFQNVHSWYPYATAPSCYSLWSTKDDQLGGRFYFGGPGLDNPYCP